MNDLHGLLSALADNVDAEIEVQTGIQKLLDQQLDILLKGGTRRLAAVLQNAEGGLETSRKLEGKRLELVAQIGAHLGIPAKEVSLKLIEERIDASLRADATALAEKGQLLKALIERIRERNRQVGLLLRHSVLFIDDLVRALTGGAGGPATYTREGTMAARTSGAIAAEA